MLVRTTLVGTGLTVTALALLLAALPTTPAARRAASPADAAGAASSIVIEGAHVFDGETVLGPTSLLLRDGRIAAVGPQVEVPEGARRIDGVGRTVLPGLFDAHVHTFDSARRDALRFGVTTLIDMFTAPTMLAGAREAREGFGPRDEAALWSAGMLATVDGGHGTQFGVLVETLAGPQEAPAWVAARLAEGSDFIKLVYEPGRRTPSLDLATARAVIAAAHAAGVMAVAHVSRLAAASDMVDAGIDGLVHVFADELADGDFVARARERGIFVVPTLTVIAAVDGRSSGPGLVADPRLGPRLDAMERRQLETVRDAPLPGFSLDVAIENVRRLHAAGVPILAGSDAPNPGTVHGASVHAELELLTRAGLTPVQALAAATAVPARTFAAAGRGVIAPGARADLVLVDGRPDLDIRATRAIAAVLRNGYLVDAVAGAAETRAGTVTTVASDAKGDAARGDGRGDGEAPPPRLPALLGDFDAGIEAPPGLLWAATSDARMGGTSDASLSRLERAGPGAGALGIEATVRAGFPYPFAGVYLGPAAGGRQDLTDVDAIAFEVRGTPADYRLMLFEEGAFGAPPTATFSVHDDWQQVEIPLQRFAGFEPSRFSGLAFVTPMAAGDYVFALDEVRLVRRQTPP